MAENLVLIVDDEEDIGFIYAQALKMKGFQTEIIRDGATASRRLKEVVPIVVVLDLHLPLVGGIELLRQIRADARLDLTRVLAITANDRLVDIVEPDADVVLLKPVKIEALCDQVKALAGGG